MNVIIKPKKSINGKFLIPSDKSISHRAVMLGSIANGRTEIENFLESADCLATIDCFRKMGINIFFENKKLIVEGKGLHGLKPPSSNLDVKNSGTTMRLISGILSGQNFDVEITGDESIKKRPMDRIITPLTKMGADIKGKSSKFAPLKIKPSPLNGINYELPVKSAQVKSAILFASLYANGQTMVIEPSPTRDHTEIMLEAFGADIKKIGTKIIISPIGELIAQKITVPSDFSSAAYFIAMALVLENSHIVLENIGVNPTRIGLIHALCEMGADINILNNRKVCGEMVADIEVKSSKLRGIKIGGDIIPIMIDEIPIFAVIALFANGKTIIENAEELMVKESNRIFAMVTELKKMGANIEATPDGMIISGTHTSLKGANLESYGDHRIAMSLAVAGMKADSEIIIKNADCVDVSFPDFFKKIELGN